MEYKMKSINNEVTLKSFNLAILDEIQTIRKLQRVITKPARQAELNDLLSSCLNYLTIINNKGVSNVKT